VTEPEHTSSDPHVRRLLGSLPGFARRAFAWLERPAAKWVRLPLGCALIVGGFLGFLPILGFWMIPIGALMIGQDIPPIRRVTVWALAGVQRWWDARRR